MYIHNFSVTVNYQNTTTDAVIKQTSLTVLLIAHKGFWKNHARHGKVMDMDLANYVGTL
jgi:hypothetical protein